MFNVNCQCGDSASRIIWFKPAKSQRKTLSPACVCENCYQKLSAVKKDQNTHEWSLEIGKEPSQNDYALG